MLSYKLIYTRFVGKYVTGRRMRFRPNKVYIFLIRITSQVDLAISVCPSVRMNSEISETIRARLLRFGIQIPGLLARRKFVSAECHAHFNSHCRKSPSILQMAGKGSFSCPLAGPPPCRSQGVLHLRFSCHVEVVAQWRRLRRSYCWWFC